MLPPEALLANVMGLAGGDLIIILIIALLIFGHKLPSVARSLGSSVSEFKKGVKEGELEAQRDQTQTQPASPSAQAAPPTAQPLSQIKCGACGTIYLPTAIGAPCPGCGTRPGIPSAAEKN